MTRKKKHCLHCGQEGTDNFCSVCGQSLNTKRLTIGGIMHEVFHFFTHIDKGLPYTLKKLTIAPGIMQKEYIEGHRAKYQKPFSMFFLTSTFTGLTLYWISDILMKYYNAGNTTESTFFHHYWVILQVIMMPLYSLITHLFFFESKYNYAEITVSQLYKFSFLFPLITFIHLFKFIEPELQTRYIEVPLIIIYSLITNVNFFDTKPYWLLILKSVLAFLVSYGIAIVAQLFFMKWFV